MVRLSGEGERFRPHEGEASADESLHHTKSPAATCCGLLTIEFLLLLTTFPIKRNTPSFPHLNERASLNLRAFILYKTPRVGDHQEFYWTVFRIRERRSKAEILTRIVHECFSLGRPV
jgi:hypothetical protein